MIRALAIALLLCTGARAEISRIAAAADRLFGDMPRLEQRAAIAPQCGADLRVNRDAAYCTSAHVIYLRAAAPGPGYLLAHLLGHAIQVRHGIADHAQAAIRADRADEARLRGIVTRQVECLAGLLHAEAGLPRPDALLAAWARAEPFTGSHWGRNPLRLGPRVSIGGTARAASFRAGYDSGIEACAAIGEGFAADLLRVAYRGD